MNFADVCSAGQPVSKHFNWRPIRFLGTHIVQQHQLVALAPCVSGDAGELGDQVRRDHQEDKPNESIHGGDENLKEDENNRDY